MNLTQETIKRIEDEAIDRGLKYLVNHFYAPISAAHSDGYIAGATAEAERAAIVEAEKDKQLYDAVVEYQKLVTQNRYLNEQIQQLTSERDAYKEALEAAQESITEGGSSFSFLLDIIENVLNQFNNTENKKQ